jgi:hypothetical protein
MIVMCSGQQTGSGICRIQHSSSQIVFSLILFRRDKKFINPKTIKSWIIVIYENQGRFNQVVAEAMAKAFCEGAESVGRFIFDYSC